MKKSTEKISTTSYGQKELIISIVLALLLGVSGGYTLGAITATNEISSEKAVVTPASHEHGMFMVEADEAPSVKLTVTEDAKSGYNIKLTTEKFVFTPDSVNDENVVGEGHAHLYVDGEKIGRLYGTDYHFDGVFEGIKTFRVTLNGNMHGEYAVNGNVIDDEVEVTHNATDPKHAESHSEATMEKTELKDGGTDNHPPADM